MRILIIDDDPAIRILLNKFLSPYGQCEQSASGGEGLEKIRESLKKSLPYDLITLDLMMPGEDGQDILRKIRELEKQNGIDPANHTRVVMISAKQDYQEVKKSFQGGSEAYVMKPIRKDNLIFTLKQLKLIADSLD